jgi:hypothetical protein
MTNVYKNILFKNNSPLYVEVYYRNILACVLEPQSTLLLKNVFNSDTKKQFDENIQLMFNSNNGIPCNIEVINYGV